MQTNLKTFPTFSFEYGTHKELVEARLKCFFKMLSWRSDFEEELRTILTKVNDSCEYCHVTKVQSCYICIKEILGVIENI